MRIHQNWLRAFCDQFIETEVPPRYALWSGIWTIASVLQNNVSFVRGSIDIHPNLYIWLIGPPRNGKSYAGQIGMKMIRLLSTINSYTGRMSESKLIKHLAELGAQHGKINFTLFSDELALTLGNGDNASTFLRLMTQLYAASFEYDTHKHGSLVVEDPCINWLALTTPIWMKHCVPPDLVGSGFVARLVAVAEPLSPKIVAETEEGDKKLFAELVVDLLEISNIRGRYTLSTAAEAAYKEWYEANRRARLAIKDIVIQNIHGREDEQVLKTAVCLMASTGTSLVITEAAIRNSISLVEAARRSNAELFRGLAVGNQVANMRTYVLQRLLDAGTPVAHSDLLRNSSGIVPDAKTFGLLIRTLKEEGSIIELKGKNGRGHWYAAPQIFEAQAPPTEDIEI